MGGRERACRSTAPNAPAFGNTASAALAEPVPLEPGTQQATAQVTLVYALDPATGR